MANNQEDNPLEQLIELLVYAPIGLLYEYPDVLPRLIKKGKSQVQLAKFAGQLALKQQSKQRQPKQHQHRSDDTTAGTAVSPDLVVEGLARLLTEVGSIIGLAPSDTSGSSTGRADSTDDHGGSVASLGEEPSQPDEVTKSASGSTKRLPIANYDSLTAKEVIFLLEDLTESQLRRVHSYEQSTRNRKTVLAKIDRLLT